MKLNIITRNITGLNDLESILRFINSLSPKVDVVMIQEQTLRGRLLKYLSHRLMLGGGSWILEVTPGERSCLNPKAACKGGGEVLLTSKYTKLVTTHGTLYDNSYMA